MILYVCIDYIGRVQRTSERRAGNGQSGEHKVSPRSPRSDRLEVAPVAGVACETFDFGKSLHPMSNRPAIGNYTYF